MKYLEGLKRGASLCFCGKLDYESLAGLKNAGMECVELSFNFDKYMNLYNFPERWEEYVEMAKDIGIEIWSIHLPFSFVLDISSTSSETRSITYYTYKKLIEAAGKAGIKVAVMHPSSEPISDEKRAARLLNSKEGIKEIKRLCDDAGMLLAVENLPRSCLCNTSGEMIDLLSDTGVGIVFDTNHSLIEDNLEFLAAIIDSKIPIYSLHISDYDFVDERHWLPGVGVNDWKGIMGLLEKCEYTGPLMYEVPSKSKYFSEEISFKMLSDNMTRLQKIDI